MSSSRTQDARLIGLRVQHWGDSYACPFDDCGRRSILSWIKRAIMLKWHTEFGHLNRGDMLTSEQHRCSNEKKKF